MRLAPFFLTALGFISGSTSSFAADINSPYKTSNRSPFIQIYGLPAAQDAWLTPQAEVELSIQYEAVSNFTHDTRNPSGEWVVIDGESHRTNVAWRYGYSERFSVGVDVPYLQHRGGGLDNFINEWHDFFGLPDGKGRSKVADNQLHFEYRDNSETLLLSQSASGVGDIQLSSSYLWSATANQQLSWRAGLKLPTGDADQLLGSDSYDVFLGLNMSRLQRPDITWHASGGLLWMSSGEVLDGRRRDWVAYGSSTLSWAYSPALSLKAQLDLHSAFYDSDTTELGSVSAQLVFGGALQLNKNWWLDLSLSEDILVETAPDVIFQLGLNRASF